MTLSGWQRLGIVITVAWVIGAAVTTIWIQREDRRTYPQNVYAVCLEYMPTGNAAKCEEIRANAQQTYGKLPILWLPVALISLAPVPLFWLAGWLVLAIARWTRRGFAAGEP